MTNAQDLIRSHYTAGKSYADIAGALTQANLKTPSGLPWDSNRVSSTIGNMKLTRPKAQGGAKAKAPARKQAKAGARKFAKAQPKTQGSAWVGQEDYNFASLVLGFVRDVQASGAAAAQRSAMIDAVLTAYKA